VQYRGTVRAPEMSGIFHRKIDELAKVFNLVERFFAEASVEDAVRYPVELAVEEVFTNVVRHNAEGGDKIEVKLRIEGDDLALSITDFDAPRFDLQRAKDPDVTLSLQDRKPGGLGVFLVKTMMDRVDYRHENGNGTVTLYKRVR